MTTNDFQTSHTKLILVLVALSYFLLMFSSGLVPLTHPDEVFYAQSAKEMIAHRSWLTPYIFDQPQFEKPIGFFLLLKAAFLLFGMTPSVARFWPGFFGILGVVMTYCIAWLLFRDKKAAFLSGVVLASSFIYIALSRSVLTDMVFSVLVGLALLSFLWGYLFPRRKTWGIVGCFVFSAAAVLTKGLLGVCFPAAIVLVFLLSKQDLAFLRCPATAYGVVLWSVLVAPWHAIMFKEHGWGFVQEYFVNVHFRRLIDAEHAKCDTWYFYPGILLIGTTPWLFYVFPALRRMFRDLKQRARSAQGYVFLLIWILGVFVFVQPASSKLASYIFPAFPAMAILLGVYFAGRKEAGRERRHRDLAGMITGLFFLAVAGGGLYAIKAYPGFITDARPVLFFTGLLALFAGLIIWSSLNKRSSRIIPMIVCIPAALLAFLPLVKDQVVPWVSCRQACEVLATVDPSQDVLLASKFYVRGVRFFTDRPVAVVDAGAHDFFSPHPIPFLSVDYQILDFLDQHPRVFGVVKDSSYEDLKRATRNKPYFVDVLFDSGGKKVVRVEKIIEKEVVP